MNRQERRAHMREENFRTQKPMLVLDDPSRIPRGSYFEVSYIHNLIFFFKNVFFSMISVTPFQQKVVYSREGEVVCDQMKLHQEMIDELPTDMKADDETNLAVVMKPDQIIMATEMIPLKIHDEEAIMNSPAVKDTEMTDEKAIIGVIDIMIDAQLMYVKLFKSHFSLFFLA